MSKRVDAESGLLDEEDTEDAGVDEAAKPITPAKTCNECWKDQAHEEDDLQVVSMLPDNDWIFVEIRDISSANSLWVLLHDHPPKMGVEKAFAD